MHLDLLGLKQMHPRLPWVWARAYAFSAAIALERRSHASGVDLQVRMENVEDVATLSWATGGPNDELQVDRHRITEDGAEAVALALASVAMGWVTLRRLQRGEAADWLLEDPEERLVALEVSGIDGDFDSSRLARKLEQAGRAAVAPSGWACVVAFGRPAVSLRGS